ncbi:MAG: hypothetical protein KC636_14055 [Myxococcales bacterium]|nr:hypothetical protein [Myxococcales bacterium]
MASPRLVPRVALAAAAAIACDPDAPIADHGAIELRAGADPGQLDAEKPAVIAIEAGDYHTCALFDSGDLRCWGANWFGQLGYGHTKPVGGDGFPMGQVGAIELPAPVVEVAAGEYHTCARLATDAVHCWGWNFYGQLGLGHTDNIGDDELPLYASGPVNLFGIPTHVSVGSRHTCAVVLGGRTRCWGANSSGQLGLGHTNQIGDDEAPYLGGGVSLERGVTRQLTGGQDHTCALVADESVFCWGASYYGQIGHGDTATIGDNELAYFPGPVSIAVPNTHAQVVAGRSHTCALRTSGGVRCWGRASHGQLGYGNTKNIGDDEPPKSQPDVPLGATATALAAGRNHTCALLTSGGVRCWGHAAYGQLGYGDTENIGDDDIPAKQGDIALGGPAVAITAGFLHTCALMAAGDVRCWGWNLYGQLGQPGDEIIGDDETPLAIGPVPLG